MKQTFFSLFFVIIALSGANAQPSILNESLSFKITTYNVEWFGCPNQGPSNEELQMNNVVKMILAMDSDVVALQEIGNTVMDTLVRRLGSEWGGRIVPNKADICGQNEAFLYRKSRVELVKAEAITQGVGTSYNWAYRFPILYQVNLLVDGNAIPVSFVNMHPKAMSDATSYGRRKEASIGLKSLFDSPAYNTKNIVLIGDFNDYIIGTQCSSCGGISPYQNFVDDSENYKILTSKLRDSYYNSSVIDHILISNELVANYVNESAGQETDAAKLISNYRQTASDHMPVSIILDFATSSAFNPTVRMHDHVSIKAWTSNGEINISGLNSGEAFQIYTISGMLVYQSVATNSQVETWRSASVQHGTYIIRQGQRAAKIVL